MVIPASLLQEMVAHARASYPNEACGLLASQDGRVVSFYPIRNADNSPVSYRMNPQEQLRAMREIDDAGLELGAIYHSHTRTRAYPSRTDVGLAFYPDALYIIVSLADREPDARAYRIVAGEISEVPLQVM